jgi:hypothetical protein
MDRDVFEMALAETVAWCATRAVASDPKWSLRSKELTPRVSFDAPDDPTLWVDESIVEARVSARRPLVREPPLDVPRTGRLLACFFEESNRNYAAADDSEWFFDGYDNPPWDTWIAVVANALITWVPPEFLALAAKGMSAECIGMLCWVDAPTRPLEPWLVEIGKRMSVGREAS